jgi:2-polyprenyl-3-methyl-5-hydroxy-6-metoxy-1,4-benzoquinol methylase
MTSMAKENSNPHLFRVPKVTTVIGRMDFVLDKCKGRKVLHLGCVDEGLTEERIESRELLHFKLISIAAEVWGVDISEEGIQLLQEHGADNLVVGNIERIDEIEELREHDFDIILSTEVLEHLNNPGLFLQGVKKLFKSNATMIVTVPNGLRLTGLMRQIKGYELVHPDHNYWFSYKTVKTLMEKNGYHIEEILAYSFFNSNLSFKNIIRKIWSIIRNKNKKSEIPSNDIKDIKKTRDKQSNALDHAYLFLKRTPELLLRKYIHKKNPFFVADGIILLVRPDGNQNIPI